VQPDNFNRKRTANDQLNGTEASAKYKCFEAENRMERGGNDVNWPVVSVALTIAATEKDLGPKVYLARGDKTLLEGRDDLVKRKQKRLVLARHNAVSGELVPANLK
jgi:hypothetical protein